jgi:hypothetical protein
MPFIDELQRRPRAMINHRLLVQSKWCKTMKKVNPAGYWTQVTSFVVGRACHYSMNASRKGGYALVLLITQIHCTSSLKWIHKVAKLYKNTSPMKWKYISSLKTCIYPKDFQMHQQSLDHSYCKRETSLTKLKNSKSVMILVVRFDTQKIFTSKFHNGKWSGGPCCNPQEYIIGVD